MRLLAPALIAALVAVAPPPSADADTRPAWSPTQQLVPPVPPAPGASEPFSEGSPQLGVDVQGNALAVWTVTRTSGAEVTDDVYATAAPAGQPFGPARLLIADATSEDLVVLPDGRALLTAARPGKVYQELLLTGRVDGTFGPPLPFAPAGEVVTGLFRTPQGALAMTSRGPDGPTRVRDLTADGAVGAARDVGLGQFGAAGVAYVGGAPGSVAQGADGTLVFPLGRTLVVRRPAGRWERLRTPFGRRTTSVNVAVAPDGRVSAVGIADAVYGEAAAYGAVAVAEWRPRTRRFGAVRRLPVSKRRHAFDGGPRRPWAFDPVAAYDAAGRRVLAWVEDTRPDPGAEAETAQGEAIVFARGRRTRVAARSGAVTLAPRPDGVLAVAAEQNGWRSVLARAGAPVRLAGPGGSPSTGPVLLTRGTRTLALWQGDQASVHATALGG